MEHGETLKKKTEYKYWEKEDYERLEQATSHADLLEIAVAILDRMPRPRSQLCGPISTGGAGSVEANLKRFEVVIDRLLEEKIEIFNQMPFEDPIQRIKLQNSVEGYDTDLLNKFYLPIFEGGHVDRFYFLPDWQTSRGASWEHEQAKRLGIEIVYLDSEADE